MWNDRRRIKKETKMTINKEWRYCISSCFWDVRHRLCQQFSLQPNLSNKKINSTRRSIVASGFWQFLYLKLHHILYLRNKFRIINSNSQLYKIRIWSRRKIHRRKRWELSDAGVLIEEARVRTRVTQKVFSLLLTQCVTASKKVSSAFGEALHVNGRAFPRRKKNAVSPATYCS